MKSVGKFLLNILTEFLTMKKSYSLLCISWLVLFFTFSIGHLSAQVDYEALDTYLEEARVNFGMPGLAVAIVKEDKVVFAKGYGLRKMGGKNPVTEQSLFGVASCSKAFTATAVAMLVDDGKLNWEDRVIDHLPDFQLHDPYITRELRVRDLLCHRSGFNTFDGDLLWYASNYDRKEVVKRIRHLPIKNSLRYKYGYSNVMFITAGEVIEAVSGMSWDDFLKERIFKPLKMDHTNTSINDFKPNAERAMPHVNGAFFPYDINYDNCGPAASLNSSVSDLSQWVRFWLNQGKVGENALLTSASYREILSSQMALKASSFDNQQGINFKSYGLGWFLFDYQGKKVVEHDGGLPGYISKVAFMPEENLGVIVLTNGMPILMNEAIRNHIFDQFLGTAEVDWSKAFSAYAKNYEKYKVNQELERLGTQIKGTSPSLELKEYAGTYSDKMYGEANIEFKDGALQFSMSPTKELFNGTLAHWHYNTFQVTLKDPFLPFGLVTFEFDSEGAVSGFTIDLPNPDFHFYNLKFERVGE